MSKSKPPVWFWVVSVLALIWNLMGVKAYLDQAFGSGNALQDVANSLDKAINPTPAWVTAAFAIAVWGGAAASLLLLLRKKLAHTIFIVSLIGIVAQMFYNFFIANVSDFGPGGISMPIMIIAFGIGLVFFAKKGKEAGWLS